jgi:hypothetical protein
VEGTVGHFLDGWNESRPRLFWQAGEGAGWGASVYLAEEYRQNALDCFRRAQDAPTLGDRTAWLSMAQLWLQFARHAEEEEALATADGGTAYGLGDAMNGRSRSTTN